MRFAAIFAVLILIPLVSADGGVYYYPTNEKDHPILADESRQIASINYEDGIENMLIAVQTKIQGEQAFWIFPVPGNPKSVKVDVLTDFPKYSGEGIESRIGTEMRNLQYVLVASQVYPLAASPLIALWQLGIFNLGASYGGSLQSTTLNKGYGSLPLDVEVYSHVESEGMVLEVVTAKDAVSLRDYFQRKGVSLPYDAMEVAQEYIGDDYCFVIGWISDATRFTARQKAGALGVSVSFPSEEIYYPLKFTSLYGEKMIPIVVYVNRHVLPDAPATIQNRVKVKHYIQEKLEVSRDLRGFFNGQKTIKNLRYTKATISAPSNVFVDDLYFTTDLDSKTKFASFFTAHTKILSILIYGVCSVIASLSAGLIAYRAKKSPLTFIYLGVSNFLTLIGLALLSSKKLIDIGEAKGESLPRKYWEKLKKPILALVILSLMIVVSLMLVSYLTSWNMFSGSRIRSTTLSGLLTLFYIFLFLALLFLPPILIFLYILTYFLNKPKAYQSYIILFTVIFLVLSLGVTAHLKQSYTPVNKPHEVITMSGFAKLKPALSTFESDGYRTIHGEFTNGVGHTATINSVSGDCSLIDANPQVIKAGYTTTMTLDCSLTEDVYVVSLKINYSVSIGNTTTSYVDSGTIRGIY